MKKILCVFAVLMLIFSVGCSNEKDSSTSVKSGLTAQMLMTPEDVSGLVDYEMTANAEETYLKSSVTYTSNPLGKDPVIVELYSYNGKNSVAAIHDMFKEKREKRPNSQDISDYDMDCFISYPSINLYCDGYMVVVTAGSGADEVQAELLKNFGAIAAEHLKEYLKKNPTDSNLLG